MSTSESGKLQAGGWGQGRAMQEHDQLQRALLLTVKWNRLDFARGIMSSLAQTQEGLFTGLSHHTTTPPHHRIDRGK